jgi:phosphatidylglycerophosphate synthase
MASSVFRSLRRQFAVLAILGFAVLALLYFRLANLPSVRGWLIVASFALVFQLWILYGDLFLNHAIGAKLRPSFGAGTWLSAARLVGLSLLAGLLAAPRPSDQLAWLPFWLALAFNLSDLFDGYLARRSGGGTLLGAKLDLDLDGRGMLVVTLLAVKYGQAGWWFALAGVARYVYVAVLWLHARSGGKLAPVPQNPLRRPFAGVEMGVATALLAQWFSPPATNLVATLTLLPFLGNFFADWLQVTGRVKAAAVKRAAARFKPLAVAAALLLLRGLMAFLLLQRAWLYGVSSLAGMIDLVVGLYLLLGIAGRPAALLALIVTAARLEGAQYAQQDYALIIGLSALMYLGMGAWQLWEPERDLVNKRLAEKRP